MNDPIVEEVRKFRQEHAERFHGNLDAICEDLRSIQQTCGHLVVSFQPKRLKPRIKSDINSKYLKQAAA